LKIKGEKAFKKSPTWKKGKFCCWKDHKVKGVRAALGQRKLRLKFRKVGFPVENFV